MWRVAEITVEELKKRMDAREDIQLLDVREPSEFSTANLGGTLIPLGELTQRYQELDPNRETVVLCHHGVRSAQAVTFLQKMGYDKVSNLRGGIDRWSSKIDPTVPRY